MKPPGAFSGGISSEGDPSGVGPWPQADLGGNVSSARLQPRLLKYINSLRTKEELLAYAERSHQLLDSINLVTCLYRLASMYGCLQQPAVRVQWRADLLGSPSFALLLGAIHTHLTQSQAAMTGQAQGSTALPQNVGVNARCLSNLIWSLVKLEAIAEDGHAFAPQVVAAASPLVLYYLPECSGQGLANLLWSYAKIPTTYASVMTAIVTCMVQVLQDATSAQQLDAQALSNSIWAIAHVRSRPNDLDSQADWQEAVTSFLLLMANQCLVMLTQLVSNEPPYAMQPTAASASNKNRFSCQALVNIAWSFSSILGSACGTQDPVCPLLLLIKQLAIVKLQSGMGSGLQLHQPWVYSLSGSFNEQALSNLVFAYDKAGLLDAPLLQAVLDVAVLRLNAAASAYAGAPQQFVLPFKPQEMCTLLRACQLGLAEPWQFLSLTNALLQQYPHLASTWSSNEMAELARGLELLRQKQATTLSAAVRHVAQGGHVALPSAYNPQAVSVGGGAWQPGGGAAMAGPSRLQLQREVPMQQVWVYDPSGGAQPSHYVVRQAANQPIVLQAQPGYPAQTVNLATPISMVQPVVQQQQQQMSVAHPAMATVRVPVPQGQPMQVLTAGPTGALQYAMPMQVVMGNVGQPSGGQLMPAYAVQGLQQQQQQQQPPAGQYVIYTRPPQ